MSKRCPKPDTQFEVQALQYILSLGARKLGLGEPWAGMYSYCLETVAGTLLINVHQGLYDGLHCRFLDVAQANKLFNNPEGFLSYGYCPNPFSGKWNLTLDREQPLDRKLDAVRRHVPERWLVREQATV